MQRVRVQEEGRGGKKLTKTTFNLLASFPIDFTFVKLAERVTNGDHVTVAYRPWWYLLVGWRGPKLCSPDTGILQWLELEGPGVIAFLRCGAVANFEQLLNARP